MKKFDRKGKNRVRIEKGGWEIKPERSKGNPHGGSKWKLFNKKGKRVVTLDRDGKILRH